MPKFIIRWNVGYGDNLEVVDANSETEARNLAYQSWREESENSADYGTLPYTQDNCEDYDLDWEDE